MPRLHRSPRLELLALCALASLATGCTRERAKRAAPTAVAPLPPLELPALVAQRPLPARRVLQLFHTSNVAAELEPCG